MEEMKDEIKMHHRDEKGYAKSIEELKTKEKLIQETVNKLTISNEELKHKLSIKKKRDNKAIKDKITSSFAGVPTNNPVYSSFAFRARDSILEDEVTPKHLGDYPEMQEVDGLI